VDLHVPDSFGMWVSITMDVERAVGDMTGKCTSGMFHNEGTDRALAALWLYQSV